MNRDNYALFGILFVVIVLIGYALLSLVYSPLRNSSFSVDEIKQLPAQSTGTTNPGDVEITLTPYIGGKEVIIAAAFNTHSVDLSAFDIRQAAVLQYQTKVYSPTSASPLQGHHGSGEIIFKTDLLIKEDKEFTVTLTGIPLIQERKYSWRYLP